MNLKLLLFLALALAIAGLAGAQKRCFPQPRIVIRGYLREIKHPIAVIETQKGKFYHVRLGPYWFWKQRGYRLEPGQEVRIRGLKKGKLIFPITIETPRGRYSLRDECGIPLWRKKP